MCRLLSSVHAVIPSHWGTFPLLTGTPEQLRALTTDIANFEVIALQPGQSLPA
jgi:L-ascorbate metabolism protein UlaG (beta-lactamase superfamily)